MKKELFCTLYNIIGVACRRRARNAASRGRSGSSSRIAKTVFSTTIS